jgi:tetratricopeptide (TPR) repeat protein
MDVWAWVHETTEELRASGQGRLADLMDEVSSACCDGEHERVENMVPEALALARALKRPWIEVFVRHWFLQSRVLHRHDVSRDTMKHAVSLIELASRPETRDCPQSVCAVQDLASAYGLVDGVGFAEQRLAVTEEALSRINPSWPCFDCVSSERASALLDQRRYAEALEFCDGQLGRQPASSTGLRGNRFRALSALGRHPEAARAAVAIDFSNAGESGEVTSALYRALAAARLGQIQEALELLPSFERLEPEHYVDWLRCVRDLGPGEGHPGSWRVERPLSQMARTLSGYESYFTLAKVHKLAAQIALQRGARGSVERHLAAATRAAAQLREPGWLVGRLDAIRSQLLQLPQPGSVSTVEAALAAVGDDPEADLDLLATSSALPSDPELERIKARALLALGAEREASALLEAAVQGFPSEEGLFLLLLETLRAGGDHARLEELCAARSGAGFVGARWAWARSLVERGDAAAAEQRCRELLEREPEHDAARALLASLLRDAGDLDGSLAQLDVLVQHSEPGNADWDRMLTATLAGRWDVVRESAKRLDLPVEADESGPIDERWHACRIRVRLADGQSRAFFAWRTGPVTARIDEVCAPGLEQHHADLVAFDAEPLNHDEVERAREAGNERALWEYGAYRILAPGGYRAFDVDGLAPDEATLERLKELLGEHGIVWEQRSDEHYVAEVAGQQVPATYAYLGVPSTCSDEQAHRVLGAAAEALSLQLIWRKLAQAAGDADLGRAQQALADAWGIE